MEPPEFSDPSLTAGNWDGAGFTNLLRNPDLTGTWFNFNNWFLNSLSVRLPVNFDQSILASLQDPATSGWYFSRVTTSLSQTYWGKIGASNFELLGRPLPVLVAGWLPGCQTYSLVSAHLFNSAGTPITREFMWEFG